ncbi:MAG: RNA methyltransferase [Spirosomaceae bacterium]|jgi:TrmH family RNA methyltransferase|nr:RNA methyltransferase [Spirosomataceae bacterium]
MVSKNLQKYLHALQTKKYRQEYGAFLVEGAKSVLELLASDYQVECLLMSETFYKENRQKIDKQPFRAEIATPEELARVGTLQTNDAALAVVKTKSNDFLYAHPREYALVLDDIRDPGNLGTIIRIADWYGISKIICSLTTTDWYNPKVIAASKGSFVRVRGFYVDLEAYFGEILSKNMPTNIYGAFLEGQNIHKMQLANTGGYIVMGNESNGISTAVGALVNQPVTIPRFGQAESLNVGIATAIVLDNLRRTSLNESP